jgi:hypothetical protein
MTARRNFLKAFGAAAVRRSGRLANRPALVEEAREIVRRGVLGRVCFCRVGNPAILAQARSILPAAMRDCIIELNPAAEGAAFLGTRATLVISGGACRVLHGPS